MRREPAVMSLADGRAMSWHEFGDPAGVPCVFLGGTGASGLAGAALHAAASTGGVRLICPDRPGLGRSDPAPRRPLAAWADDVDRLMDHLGVDRFGVLGHSAGGAFALALTRRATLTVIGAGSPPYAEPWTRADGLVSGTSRFYNGLASRAPGLFGALYRLGTPRSAKAVDRLVAMVGRGASADARFAREHPDQTRASLEALADGCRQGGSGPTGDTLALCRPWGFALEEVTGPVHWWHGEQDTTVMPRAGRAVVARLPDVTAHFVDGGHYVLYARADEIMRSLKQAA